MINRISSLMVTWVGVSSESVVGGSRQVRGVIEVSVVIGISCLLGHFVVKAGCGPLQRAQVGEFGVGH